MTLLEAIQEANTAAGIDAGSLAFAQLQEFNSFMDSFEFDDYPVNVVVPIEINGVITEPYRIKDVAVIQGWMLTRIAQDTNDYRSVQIEPTYINPMRILAKKFMVALLNTDIIDPEVSNVSYSIMPEYQFLNAHLFGVSYRINLPVHSRVC